MNKPRKNTEDNKLESPKIWLKIIIYFINNWLLLTENYPKQNFSLQRKPFSPNF